MGLQHFSHEHPLNFFEDEEFHDEDGNIRCCDACKKPMMSITPSYSCTECHFYLHKLCAQLPQEKKHPLHPKHPLTLLPKPVYYSVCSCYQCGSKWGNFTYHCSICKFNLDIVCASLMDLSFEHPSHQHPLTRTLKPILTECDACNTKHEGIFYLCNTCSFMIHHDCLTLPYRIDRTHHHEHPLALAYSTPPQYTRFYNYCEICTKEVEVTYATYYCGECRYFAHTHCATSKNEPFMSILLPWSKAEWAKFKVVDPRPGVVQLPVPDESVNLIDHFNQSTARLEQRERTIEDKFVHFSHDHPLILSNEHEEDDDKLISEGKCCLLHNKKNDQILCAACIIPIITTAPFYRCIEKCGFFLHISCAELPTEVQHPGHDPQHSLILLPRSPTPLGVFWCKGCALYCNGFVYSCAECDDYKLDVICGSLPMSIQHESHKEHILSIKPSLSTRCHASYIDKERASLIRLSFAYHCESCNFEVLPRFIQLPCEMRHRYDEVHPFILTYSPVKGTHHSGQYICDACERELDPRAWFYHCVDCDQSMHFWCLPQFDEWSSIKFGGTFSIERHPHPLTLLPLINPNTFFRKFPHVVTNDTKCDTIGRCNFQDSYIYDLLAVKCLECNFKLHYECALQNGDYI